MIRMKRSIRTLNTVQYETITQPKVSNSDSAQNILNVLSSVVDLNVVAPIR
jgi:hypothetical protein